MREQDGHIYLKEDRDKSGFCKHCGVMGLCSPTCPTWQGKKPSPAIMEVEDAKCNHAWINKEGEHTEGVWGIYLECSKCKEISLTGL